MSRYSNVNKFFAEFEHKKITFQRFNYGRFLIIVNYFNSFSNLKEPILVSDTLFGKYPATSINNVIYF